MPPWLLPFAKKAGAFVLTNGPTIIEYTKKYGPPTLDGFKTHGFKPVKVFNHVRTEVLSKPAGRTAGSKGTAPAADTTTNQSSKLTQKTPQKRSSGSGTKPARKSRPKTV